MSDPEEREAADLLGQLKVTPSAGARERAFAKLQDEFAAQGAPSLSSSQSRRYARWAFAAGIALAITGAWLARDASQAALVARVESLDGTVEARGTGWLARTTSLESGGGISSGSALRVSDQGGVLMRVSPDLTVRLAAGTHARFNNAGELELSAGQAFIDATPGANVPLNVVTPYGVVSHLGTQYLVRLDGHGVEVAVREGRAQLRTKHATAVAEAGHWLLQRDAGTASQSGDLAAADPRFEWIGALPTEFRLEGATLAGFLAWFQRETGLTPIYSLGFDAGRFAQVQLKGSIEDLEPLEALSYVLATADLAWHREGAKVVIEQNPAGTR